MKINPEAIMYTASQPDLWYEHGCQQHNKQGNFTLFAEMHQLPD